ncbi:DUF2247 family protein [Gordonia sp. DT218]|uniref:DUF2247 family protein n=1 Tax=Gordonia sp. DT218 TaxID=3416659 RepID=UPI003CEDB883
MTDRLVDFRLPARFIGQKVLLTPAELRWGYDNLWVEAEDVVALTLTSVVADPEPLAAVEELSLLLSDELDRVPELIGCLTPDPEPVWMYLTTEWVVEHPADFAGAPLETVEQLYTDFGYPAEMEGFITYMPTPPGGTPGIDGLWERLREFLAAGTARFGSARRPGGSAG